MDSLVDTLVQEWSKKYSSNVENDWIWRTGTFAGEFADAFIMNTNLEGGDVPKSIGALLSLCRPLIENENLSSKFLSQFNKEELNTLSKLFDDFEKCIEWGKKLVQLRNIPSKFIEFLNEWITAIKRLKVGERLIINGGWLFIIDDKVKGHACIYVVERDSESTFGFTVVNTGVGTEFHPLYRGDYPKEKRRAAIRIGEIARERIVDEAFWYLLFKLRYESSTAHDSKLIYEVLLPFIANPIYRDLSLPDDNDATFSANLDNEIRKGRCGDFETLQRSGTCFFRAILSTLRYCCKRVGFSISQRKQFMHSVRISFLFRVFYDINILKSKIQSNLKHQNLQDLQNNKDYVCYSIHSSTLFILFFLYLHLLPSLPSFHLYSSFLYFLSFPFSSASFIYTLPSFIFFILLLFLFSLYSVKFFIVF